MWKKIQTFESCDSRPYSFNTAPALTPSLLYDSVSSYVLPEAVLPNIIFMECVLCCCRILPRSFSVKGRYQRLSRRSRSRAAGAVPLTSPFVESLAFFVMQCLESLWGWQGSPVFGHRFLLRSCAVVEINSSLTRH